MPLNILNETQLKHIQEQMHLSENFTILSLEKKVYISGDQPGYNVSCSIPEHWYLVAVQDSKKGFRADFIWLNNLRHTLN